MFDFSYIDGDHAYHAVRRDTLLVLGYATDNHVIVFDDYSTQFPGVPRFVEEMRECKGVEQIAHVHPDIAFVVQKPST
ncbi:MAG: class I SAM-dependent methyltransferase, partial [Pseudomonadota bacterium]